MLERLTLCFERSPVTLQKRFVKTGKEDVPRDYTIRVNTPCVTTLVDYIRRVPGTVRQYYANEMLWKKALQNCTLYRAAVRWFSKGLKFVAREPPDNLLINEVQEVKSCDYCCYYFKRI